MINDLENSEIRPARGLLSGREMHAHHVGNYDFHTGLDRLVSPEEEEGQLEHISRIKDDFRRVLLQHRVGKEETYSIGEWEDDRKRVRITKAVGKWNIYGFLENQIRFVDGYEALYLMEMNRLIVYWQSVTISVEQAYSLFLGGPHSLSLEEYHVYNTLMRSGFYLLKCDPNRKYHVEDVPRQVIDEEAKCVWKNLYDMLRQPNPLMNETDCDVDTELYGKVRKSMLGVSSIIKSQSDEGGHNENRTEGSTDRRKLNGTKRFKKDHNSPAVDSRSRLDKFKDIFQNFDIIRSTLEGIPEPNATKSDLKLLFDVFPSDGSTFKKSAPVVPEYRIFVRAAHEQLPTATDIAHLFHSQANPAVPLLLMQVSDALSIHCFLYNFHVLPKMIITASSSTFHGPSHGDEMNSEDSDTS